MLQLVIIKVQSSEKMVNSHNRASISHFVHKYALELQYEKMLHIGGSDG